MEDIPETYQLETIEQMRALSEELRIRIIEALGQQAMTSKQLALLLGEAPAKVHYHLHELEKVGLVKLVDIREKGNMLEKYYRAVARNISASETFFQRVPPDETIAAMREFFQQISQRFIEVLTDAVNRQAWEEHISLHLAGEQLWLTNEEYHQLVKQIGALVEPYKYPRKNAGEQEHTFVEIIYPVLPTSAREATAETSAPVGEPTPPAAAPATTPPANPHIVSSSLVSTSDERVMSQGQAPPKKTRIFGAGAFLFSRQELEAALTLGKPLDIQVLGACSFAEDVTPELIERAIGRFRCRGKVNASPEVREALKRKEMKPEAEQ